MTNLLYSKFDEIQYYIRLLKFNLLINELYSQRGEKMPKNTFLNRNLCVLILNFDHEESFTNISHYNRIQHQT